MNLVSKMERFKVIVDEFWVHQLQFRKGDVIHGIADSSNLMLSYNDNGTVMTWYHPLNDFEAYPENLNSDVPAIIQPKTGLPQIFGQELKSLSVEFQ